MDYLDFSKEMTRMLIKNSKNSILMQRGAFYFCALVALLNISILINNHNIVTAFCVGALIVNSLYMGAHLIFLKQDLKFEKEKLAHIEKLQEDENLKGAILQLKASKEYYEDFMASTSKSEHKLDAARYFNDTYLGNKRQESASPTAEKS